MVYPLAYAILLLPLRLELRYTGMALTPADGDGSIWVEHRDLNSNLQYHKLPCCRYTMNHIWWTVLVSIQPPLGFDQVLSPD